MSGSSRRLDDASNMGCRWGKRRAIAVTASLLVGLIGVPCRAEVPPMSDADMQAAADLIATGIVAAVLERDDVSYPARGQKLVTGRWTIVLTVGAIEKGRLEPDERNLRFTGERNIVVPKGWLGGTNTLRLTPQVGDEVKVDLVHTAGEWRLIHHLGLWLRR